MISLKSNLAVIIFLCILFPFWSIGQSENDTINNFIDESENFSFLMINASYTNNNLEYVVNATNNEYETAKIPTLFTNLSYVNKTGLYLGGSYANYFNASTQTYDYNIDAGFQKYFDNGYDFDFYYSKHRFSGDSLLEGINYDHSLNFSTGIDIGKFYISTDLSYLIAQKNNFFLDINFSRFFQIDKILFKNDVLLINPSVSLTFGTDYWIYEDMTLIERNQLVLDLRSKGYSFNSFSYEGFDIFLPISYGIGNTYLSFSALYRIPGDKYKYLGWENQLSLMFSLTYFLNFSNK